jgi:hypothetical protein
MVPELFIENPFSLEVIFTNHPVYGGPADVQLVGNLYGIFVV